MQNMCYNFIRAVLHLYHKYLRVCICLCLVCCHFFVWLTMIFSNLCISMYILTLDPRVAHARPRSTRAPRHVMCHDKALSPHISRITGNATHDVAHAQEVIVNHGECSMAMPAWVGGRCEIGNDRRYIPSSKCLLKNTLPNTINGHRHKSPNIGEKCLVYVRYFAQEKVLHTFRAGKSGMVFVAKTQFLPKNPLDNLLSTS